MPLFDFCPLKKGGCHKPSEYIQVFLIAAEVFVVLVLLTSFLDLWNDDPQYEVMELFAGASRITRLAKSLGLSACGHDVTFDHEKKSCFNLLDNAGFVFLRC